MSKRLAEHQIISINHSASFYCWLYRPILSVNVFLPVAHSSLWSVLCLLCAAKFNSSVASTIMLYVWTLFLDFFGPSCGLRFLSCSCVPSCSWTVASILALLWTSTGLSFFFTTLSSKLCEVACLSSQRLFCCISYSCKYQHWYEQGIVWLWYTVTPLLF